MKLCLPQGAWCYSGVVSSRSVDQCKKTLCPYLVEKNLGPDSVQ